MNRTKPFNCTIVNHIPIKNLELSDEFAKNCIKKYWLSPKLLAFTFGKKIKHHPVFLLEMHYAINIEIFERETLCEITPKHNISNEHKVEQYKEWF